MRAPAFLIAAALTALAAQRAQQSGLDLTFDVTPAAPATRLAHDAGALVKLTIKDARSGQPVTGLRPSLWFDRRRDNGFAQESSCRDKAKMFAAGGLAGQADVDLNAFLLVTLNSDRTVTFINPVVRFEPTRLESVVTLPGQPYAWAATRDQALLAITLPGEGRVAVLDTAQRKLLHTITTGGRPSHLLIDSTDRFAWVALEGGTQAAVVDLTQGTVAARVTAGPGPHHLSAGSTWVAIASTPAGSVSVFDIALRQPVARFTLPAPSALAWSDASQAFWAASPRQLHLLDPTRPLAPHALDAAPGITALHFPDGGRWGLALSRTPGRLQLIDAAARRIAASSALADQPDQLLAAAGSVWIRSATTNRLTLFDWPAAVERQRLEATELTLGQAPPSALSPAVSPLLTVMPGGRTVAVASTGDQVIYTYAGVKLMGAHRNYRRTPLGLLALDRGLRETAPGEYTAPVRFPFGGTFDVPVLLDQPRLSACFTTAVAGPRQAPRARSAATATARPTAELLTAEAGRAVSLRFTVTDVDTGAPVTGLLDVRGLAVRLPTTQVRLHLHETQPGTYEATQAFTAPGEYRVMVSSESRLMGFTDSPVLRVQVRPEAAP